MSSAAVSDLPLYHGVKYGSLVAVQDALTSGVIPHVSHLYNDDTTPLLLSVRAATDTVVCEYLLSKGANVFTRARSGWTCLHEAASSGKLDVCKLLLLHEASVSGRALVGDNTPLWLAAKEGHADICKLLVENGASVTQELDAFGISPLAAACRHGHVDACALLLSVGAPAEDGFACESRPLTVASRHGHSAVCALLLAHGANPNAIVGRTGPSKLMMAASVGGVSLCERLLASGADPAERDLHGNTPLHYALGGDARVCTALLAYGADPRATNACGQSTLVYVTHPDICCMMLEEGADVLLKDFRGNTALTLAIQDGHKSICMLLAAYCAPVTALTSVPGLPEEVEDYVAAIRDAGWRRRLPAFTAYVAAHGVWWK